MKTILTNEPITSVPPSNYRPSNLPSQVEIVRFRMSPGDMIRLCWYFFVAQLVLVFLLFGLTLAVLLGCGFWSISH